MSDSLPTSIRQRDGRLVPFEPEKLSRSLFAAAEALGRPDAFLARELTDGVLHFFTRDAGAEPPTTALLAELTAKVVRELGHPALARAYEEILRKASSPPEPRPAVAPETFHLSGDPFAVLREAARERLRDYSLSRVYPRDLVSAHRDGLLHLMDLDAPLEMTGLVLSPMQPPPLDGWELLETLTRIRGLAGSFVAIDGPEHAIAAREGIPEEMAGAFVAVLDRCLGLANLDAVLNLNTAEPPAWALPINAGLFQEFQREMEAQRLDRIAVYLLRHARKQTVYWHVGERDVREGANQRLAEVVNRAAARDGVEFVFDRPNRAVMLGPGVDRRNPAALGMVAIDLPRFVDQLGGGPVDPALYLKKLGSLARFAKSAGHARQDHLRQHGRPALREGFLVERAIEIVVPIGLADAARRVIGDGARPDDAAGLARRSVETIRLALETDRPRAMGTRIDSPWPAAFGPRELADSKLLPRQQIRYESALHAAAGGGCVTVFLNRSDPSGVSEMPDLIRAAWRGDVHRLRIAWVT